MNQNHTCAAPVCKRKVPMSMLMCRSHWFALPQHLRTAIWNEYIPGQEYDLAKPTEAYLAAVEEAVAYLNDKEGNSAQGQSEAEAGTGA